MRILVLTSTFPRWSDDTEPRFVYDLSLELSKEHTVDILAPHVRGSKVNEQLGPLTVHRFRYCIPAWEQLAYGGGMLPNVRNKPVRLLLVPLYLLFQIVAIYRLLRRNSYDVIHAHWIIPQGFSAIIAACLSRKKTPVVLTSHGGDLFALKGRLLGKLKYWISHRCQHLTVVSSAMQEKAANMGLKSLSDISVIPMGTYTQDRFVPPACPASRQGILFVGRLVDKKGVEYLIRALPAISARFPQQYLSVVGDGPLLDELKELAQELGVTDSVRFLGGKPNEAIPSYLQRARVTVFPSVVAESGDQEGTPVAIMEALACACACVVCDYPGVRDIIRDGETGLLAAQRSPDEIAAQVLRLLSDQELAESLGKQGRNHVVEHYDWQVVERQFSEVFTRQTCSATD